MIGGADDPRPLRNAKMCDSHRSDWWVRLQQIQKKLGTWGWCSIGRWGKEKS